MEGGGKKPLNWPPEIWIDSENSEVTEKPQFN